MHRGDGEREEAGQGRGSENGEIAVDGVSHCLLKSGWL